TIKCTSVINLIDRSSTLYRYFRGGKIYLSIFYSRNVFDVFFKLICTIGTRQSFKTIRFCFTHLPLLLSHVSSQFQLIDAHGRHLVNKKQLYLLYDLLLASSSVTVANGEMLWR